MSISVFLRLSSVYWCLLCVGIFPFWIWQRATSSHFHSHCWLSIDYLWQRELSNTVCLSDFSPVFFALTPLLTEMSFLLSCMCVCEWGQLQLFANRLACCCRLFVFGEWTRLRSHLWENLRSSYTFATAACWFVSAGERRSDVHVLLAKRPQNVLSSSLLKDAACSVFSVCHLSHYCIVL